ncbi:MAG: hypothetical protein E7616_02135 [Ruminococcaceae bacterium]|nr:hypothetical protein [Oscillospiraceae bacterium]
MSEQNKNENTSAAYKKHGGNKNRRPGKYGRYPGKKRPKEQENQTVLEETLGTDIRNDEPYDEQEEITSLFTFEESVSDESIETAADIQITDNIGHEDTTESAAEPQTEEHSENSDPTPELTEVIGVRFRTSGKIYYFNNCGVTYPLGCHAIVDTARGVEYGEVAMTNRMVPTSELVLPLREALRVATPDDDRHHAENRQKESDAVEIWEKKVAAHGLEMKLIDVECTFDNSKLLFYFTAEGRVDFRDLVKDLASVFRCRIELRQMGIRDEAKILGGLGVCGRPFCCHSFLPDFVQVSIKMAKEQNLSLNSAKISGACGRLMCCLRYEYDVYCEEAKLTPRVDSLVRTPEGVGTVVETKPLLGLVKVQLANSPDAAPMVFSRDLLKIIQPGEPIEDPKPTPSLPKEKPSKLADGIKAEQSSKNPVPNHRKRQFEPSERKKAPENDNKSTERQEKIAKQEKPVRNEKSDKIEKVEKTDKTDKTEPVKIERKYSIQKGKDASKTEGNASKKRDGNHPNRKNYPPRDKKDKKSGESS